MTVSVVVLAVETAIGLIVSALTRGLKSMVKGVKNYFRTLGSKIAGILPDLIGSIVGFIFKTFFFFFTKKGFIMLFTTLLKL